MNIRYKITLWIAGAGLVTSLVLSFVVFMEMREQPFEVLDQELDSAAKAIAGRLAVENDGPENENTGASALRESRYWLRVLDDNLKPIYRSDLSGRVDIPLYDKKDDGYTVTLNIAGGLPSTGEGGDKGVPFRVRVVSARIKGANYLIQIAKPIEELEEEISDLLIALFTGLSVSLVVLTIFSYFVAGRIVRPISEINSLSREINEKTLGKRIPLGKSRDEIYELSDSLNHMFDRLQFSFSRQKEFLANASHELKSPTAMLRLFFEESAQRQDLPETFRRELMQQGGNALRMERLSKALLELSALELAPSLEKEIFSLTQLIEGLLEDFSVVFRVKNMRVRLDSPENLPLAGDRNKIRRMLINFIDNAVKYNDEKGEIQIWAGMENDSVHLSVFNTGPGIPADELEKVFDQFHRVEKSRSVQYGGAGLGLSIARQIVSLHGGRIWIESKPGEWARVHVVLPRATT